MNTTFLSTKFTRVLCLIVAILGFSNFAYAQNDPYWTAKTTIRVIYVNNDGVVTMKVKTSTPNLGCGGSSDTGGWLQINTAAPNFNVQMSLLAAAMTAGRQVQINVAGCGASFPYANGIQFLDD